MRTAEAIKDKYYQMFRGRGGEGIEESSGSSGDEWVGMCVGVWVRWGVGVAGGRVALAGEHLFMLRSSPTAQVGGEVAASFSKQGRPQGLSPSSVRRCV